MLKSALQYVQEGFKNLMDKINKQKYYLKVKTFNKTC